MAQKRMFSNSVVQSDEFLEMPDSSQNLYFHLSMQADDDGFVDKWKSIMRMTGKKEDDLKILIAKSFVIPFDTGVLVIRHWRLNNYLQKDRYKETIYKNEKSRLTIDKSNVYNLDTECIHSIDKNRIDKISIEKNSKEKEQEESESCGDGFQEDESCKDGLLTGKDSCKDDFQKVSKFYEDNINLLTPYTSEVLEDYTKELGSELVIYAMQISIENNKRTISYIKAILNNWSKANIKTLAEAKNENQNKNEKKDNIKIEDVEIMDTSGLSEDEYLKQAKEEITMLTVKNKLTDEKNILSYLATLSENIYSTTAESVYKKLIELTKKRQMQKLLNESATKIKDAENIDIDIEKVIKELNKIEDREIKEESLKEQIIDTLDMIEKNMKNKNDYSLYTGMLDLDQLTCGLHNEELTIIGARPGMGKTTFALQIADYIAKKKIPVMFISLEMSEEQIITKLIAKETRINSTKMRLGTLTDQEAVKVYEAGAELEEKSLYITSNLRTIQQIEVEARKLKNKKNIGLIIIDYIQLIKSSQKFNLREQEVADITRTLKLLTLELKIPIIGLCQLNRNATRQEPMLSDLRESGAIEQDADNVIFIYQEEETDAAAPVVTIKLAKQRAGSTGKVNMIFRKVYSEFVNIIRR